MSDVTGKIASLLRKLTPAEGKPDSYFCSAVIVAGGSGTRMGQGAKTKQMMELCGMPVVARTVRAFEQTDFISEIILVIKEDEKSLYDPMMEQYGWKKVIKVIPGGETRQASVLAGFQAIDDRSDFLLIHDAARCLITPEMIRKVAVAACRWGCAIAAQRPHDTVKIENEQGNIDRTQDRNTVWLAQTPQIFRTEIYRAAVYTKLSEGGYQVTDDAMLAEQVGFTVRPVDCGCQNMKLTTPEDMFLAEAILKMRGEVSE